MAWEIKDEFINLATGEHVVLFHNREVLVDYGHGRLEPVEHHLKHHFKLEACPSCGHAHRTAAGEAVDFHQVKQDVHAALQAHHTQMMEYREKHPKVRIGTGPKV